MRVRLIEFANDIINRKNIIFTTGSLENVAFRYALQGVPALMEHDGLRPVGWNFPFALYFEPGLTRLISNFQIPETSEEKLLIKNAYKSEISRRYQEACEPHRDKLEKIIRQYQTPQGYYIGLACAAYVDENILHRLYPSLKSKLDKDGLIYIEDLLIRFEYLGQGVFKDKEQDVAIFCHRYFRRQLSYINNFQFEFIDYFMSLSANRSIKLRIALDRNVIGLASSFHQVEELEYCWGPEYSDEIESIRPGVTHFESNDRQKSYSYVSGMQFWWKKEKDKRVLEAEELRDNPTEGAQSNQYGCRYVHSIFENKNRSFQHFDGAIRMYDTEEMIVRIDRAINQAGKQAIYTKLFRIDGNLGLHQWKLLITFFFKGNPLVYEYFGLKEEYENLFSYHTQQEKGIVEQYVPFKIEKNDGVRLFLSYHRPSCIDREFDRIIINPDFIISKYGNEKAIEFSTLEIKKTLNKMGENLIIPNEFKFVIIKDDYINFPTILHSSLDTSKKLNATFNAYLILLNALASRDLSISIALAWPIEDKEVRLSVYGRLSEVIKWLSDNKNIPADYPSFRKWVEGQRAWLLSRYNVQHDIPPMLELISSDGVLAVNRKPIDKNWLQLYKTKTGIDYKILVPKKEKALLNALKNGELKQAAYLVVERALCSKTGEDYFLSSTSKILDPDVIAEIVEVSSMWAFWTNGHTSQ